MSHFIQDPFKPIINAMPIIEKFASFIRHIPQESKERILKLFYHQQKKRISLRKLGTKKHKGFVIDRETVVDGLTNRMKTALKENYHHPSCVSIRKFLTEKLDANIEYRNTIKHISDNDKYNKVKCHFRTRNAMTHGSKVHMEIYKSALYILKKADILKGKKSPIRFSIDACTKSCLEALYKSELVPISSEWPVFTENGTGCATAIDLICIDAKQGANYELCVIELKTGNMKKALTYTERDIGITKISLAMLQCSLGLSIGRKCYGLDYFNDSEFKRNAVVFVRPWGAMIIYLPRVIYETSIINNFLELMLMREQGSLRSNLPNSENVSSVLTTKNTVRKTQKKYRIGYNNVK